MSEYYAVIRSTDHLAHYGVRGMKWGVRKAKYTLISPYANAVHKRMAEKKIDKHFKKAKKKLDKLSTRKNGSAYNKFRQEMVKTFSDTKHDVHLSDKKISLQKAMDKMKRDFYKSPEREKIIRQLAKEAAKKYSDGSKESIKQYYRGYKYDDLDQGASFMRYRQQNPKADAQYRKYEEEYFKEVKRMKEHPKY